MKTVYKHTIIEYNTNMPATKTGETLQVNGRTAYKYTDGAVRYGNGAYAKRPPKAAALITKDNARSLVQRKNLLAQEAAQKGLQNAVLSASSPIAAWSAVIEKQTTLAMDIEKGRASTSAAGLVGKATKYLVADSGSDRPNVTVNVIPENVAKLALGLLYGDVIEGEWTDDNEPVDA